MSGHICSTDPHANGYTRRTFLDVLTKGLGVSMGMGVTCGSGFGWLTPSAHLLARQAETKRAAQSLIILWLAGGPSQLETFDPHDDGDISGGTKSIPTSVKTIMLAQGYEHTAEQMENIALIRSAVSPEGDHERGTITLKSGRRPDPTVVQPSIGAVCCHEMPTGNTEIPRHISILPNQWPARGGFFGGIYDAFQILDPAHPPSDLASFVSPERDKLRRDNLDVVENAFAKGRSARVKATMHREQMRRAQILMASEQLTAFDITREPLSVRAEYGDTPFGRGCLAARRLTETGVRCVEVTLDGWDSHVNNHETHAKLASVLDPAFAALVRDLKRRDMLDRTIVMCCGEFGRTPKVNLAGGRDHWSKGFTIALAGGRIRGGVTLGATDPHGLKEPETPISIPDVHATLLTALGLNPAKENVDPGTTRPIKLSDGRPIPGLLRS